MNQDSSFWLTKFWKPKEGDLVRYKRGDWDEGFHVWISLVPADVMLIPQDKFVAVILEVGKTECKIKWAADKFGRASTTFWKTIDLELVGFQDANS